MKPRQLRYSEEMVMASTVERGLLLERRTNPDNVMHALRGTLGVGFEQEIGD